MSSTIAAHVYEAKRLAIAATTLSGLVFCIFRPTPLEAVAQVPHKTDAEFALLLRETGEVASIQIVKKHRQRGLGRCG